MDIKHSFLSLGNRKLFEWTCEYAIRVNPVTLQPLHNPPPMTIEQLNKEMQIKMRFYNLPLSIIGRQPNRNKNNQVLVGKQIYVNIDLSDLGTFISETSLAAEIQLRECFLANNADFTVAKKIKIIENNCQVQENPFASIVQVGRGGIAEFALTVIEWRNRDPVFLTCEVKLCDPNIAGDCSVETDCPLLGRKRRSDPSRSEILSLDDFVTEEILEFNSNSTFVENGPLYPQYIRELEIDSSTGKLEESKVNDYLF